MRYLVHMDISNSSRINLELNDEHSPNTVKSFLDNLPFPIQLNVWGDEIYTSSSPIDVPEENLQY
ncbi:MAG TPA: cyclophilin-like family protein, partial [Nitrosopumilaceae archaeon]|nr:cyclophilin-like family protein [Nitrosopumilaceae archaeon]